MSNAAGKTVNGAAELDDEVFDRAPTPTVLVRADPDHAGRFFRANQAMCVAWTEKPRPAQRRAANRPTSGGLLCACPFRILHGSSSLAVQLDQPGAELEVNPEPSMRCAEVWWRPASLLSTLLAGNSR